MAAAYGLRRPGPGDLDEYHYDWSPPTSDVEGDIARVDAAVPGGLPLTLRGLLRFVGEVDLAGSLPSWDPSAFIFEGPEAWPPFGVYSSPMHLYGVGITLGYIDPVSGRIDPRYLDDDGSYHLYVGADATTLAGYSGGCHTVALPSNSLDPVLETLRGGVSKRLVEYLRWVFEWGGFPGFDGSSRVPDEIALLRAGLLPV